MVFDTVGFTVCIFAAFFVFMFLGWLMGYDEAKQKYKGKDVE